MKREPEIFESPDGQFRPIAGTEVRPPPCPYVTEGCPNSVAYRTVGSKATHDSAVYLEPTCSFHRPPPAKNEEGWT